jgi:uncharacterized protein YrzB (UPF0473 family)
MEGMIDKMKKTMNIIINQEKAQKYDVLCSFDSKLTNCSYVIFTDYYEDEKGQLIFSAGKYEQIDKETIRVDKNLTDIEYDMVSEVMNKMLGNVIINK